MEKVLSQFQRYNTGQVGTITNANLWKLREHLLPTMKENEMDNFLAAAVVATTNETARPSKPDNYSAQFNETLLLQWLFHGQACSVRESNSVAARDCQTPGLGQKLSAAADPHSTGHTVYMRLYWDMYHKMDFMSGVIDFMNHTKEEDAIVHYGFAINSN